MSTSSDVGDLVNSVKSLTSSVHILQFKVEVLKAKLAQRDAQHFNDRSIQRNTTFARLKMVVNGLGAQPIDPSYNLPALNTLQDLVNLDIPTVKRYLAFYGIDDSHPYLAQYGNDACLEMFLRGDPALLV
ncbi:hypothetical protein JCM1840_003377 [Sporobolomyces johnsonii]